MTLPFVQELTQTRHKLDQAQQQLQDSSSKAAQSQQQHQEAVARLTQDLEQEQKARSHALASTVLLNALPACAGDVRLQPKNLHVAEFLVLQNCQNQSEQAELAMHCF